MPGSYHRCIYAHAPKRDTAHEGAGERKRLTSMSRNLYSTVYCLCWSSQKFRCDLITSVRTLFSQQIKRIIHLEVQSKPMYLRTLLYALRQGVALQRREPTPVSSVAIINPSKTNCENEVGVSHSALASQDGSAASVPDRLLDLYLSLKDSISLTSKVLDVYAAYVDEGEVSFMLFAV